MLIFEKNREHRIHLIKNAIMDFKLWKEAMNINLKEEDNPQAFHEREREKKTKEEILREGKVYTCIVDTSWISSNEKNRNRLDNVQERWKQVLPRKSLTGSY